MRKAVLHWVAGAVTALVPIIGQWSTNLIGWKETIALSVGALVTFGLAGAHVDATQIKADATVATNTAQKLLGQGMETHQ